MILPGGVLPGGFEISARKTYGHVSAGMICSARELGLGEDHDGIIVLAAPTPGSRATTPSTCCRCATRSSSSRSTPTAPTPCPCAAWPARPPWSTPSTATVRPTTTRPTAPTPEPNAEGYPVVVDDPAGCPVFVARRVTGLDPAAPTPLWMARRIQLAGMRPISLAVDVTNYVMLEMGHPIHGYDTDDARRSDPGPPCRRGRAPHHARRRRPGAVDRGPRRLRRLRSDRPGRRDGRRHDGDVGDHHRRAGRGRALGPGVDVPHRPPPQAHLRGGQAQRARCRPDDPGGGRRPGRRAARRRTAAAPPTRASPRSASRPRGARSPSTSTCPPGSPAWRSPPTRP